MNNKLIYSIALLVVIQIGKAQTTEFYPNDIADGLNAFSGNFDEAGSARFLGMGGSMGALGGDLSAVETNPAGLGVFRNSAAQISLGVLSNRNKASMSSSYSSTDTNLNLPSSGVVFTVGNDSDLRFNFGVNYSYQRLDNEVVFPRDKNMSYLYPDVNGVDQSYILEGYEQYTDGYKSKMKFSVATNYQDKIYFGLGLDWHYMNMNRRSTYTHRSTADGEVMSFDEQLTPYNMDANGVGLSVGVIGKVTPELRLGAAYHSPIWWSDINIENTNYYTGSNDNIYGEYWYYDGLKTTAPGKITLSGAFASNIINEDNSLAFNFDFINYFNKDYQFKGDSEYRINNYFVSNYMRDSQEYRAGIEYRFKALKLRAGYAYTSSPVKDNSVFGSIDSGSTNTYVKNYLAGEKNKFSVGAGYDMGPFFVDLAYQNINTEYYTSLSGDFYNPYKNSDISIDLNNPFFGKVKNTQNNFVLTLGMRF